MLSDAWSNNSRRHMVELKSANKARIKPVRDPLIEDGKPLPQHGTCSHYRKSCRWLRYGESSVILSQQPHDR